MTIAERRPVRKALLIGIVYKRLGEDCFILNSPHHDTAKIRRLLLDDYGYRPEDITVLRDDDEMKHVQPTRKNILAAMRRLVAGCAPGDHFVFYYAGHGSQTPNFNGTEDDGMDEVIWPIDINVSAGAENVTNFIIDDDIHDILVEHVCRGAHLVLIFDCCHSGTAADLPNYNGDYCPTSPIARSYNTQVRSLRLRDGQQPTKHTYTINHNTDTSEASATSHVITPNKFTRSKNISELENMIDVTSWSACKDDQNTFELQDQGMFTRAFVDALRHNPTQSHANLLKTISHKFAKYAAQARGAKVPDFDEPIPQLSAEDDLDQVMPTPMEM